MSALAATTWVVAVAGLWITLALRLTHLDERWLPTVRLASFTTPIQIVGLLPWLVTAVLAAAHAIANPFSAAQVWILSLSIALAAVLTSPPLPRAPLDRNDGPVVVLGSLNVERDTPAAQAIATTLLDLDLDVLLVQEYTSATAAAFGAAGLLAAYPHVREDPEEGWFGSALLSRHPIVDARRGVVGRRPTTIATVRVGDHPVTLVNVHTQAPIHLHDVEPWRLAFADLADLARDADHLLVMAGDWNATLSHPPMRRLLRTHRVIDAHLASRRRAPRTWPVGRRYPPLLGLDHILVSPSIDVKATHELTLAGTDHRAVTASLRLP